jgi:hypothetical protein
MTIMNSVTPKAAAKNDLFQQTSLWGKFVEQKLMLGYSFRCDQVCNNNSEDFGHTLLCCLSQTLTFNKPTKEVVVQKFDPRLNFMCDKIHNNHYSEECVHVVVLLKKSYYFEFKTPLASLLQLSSSLAPA